MCPSLPFAVPTCILKYYSQPLLQREEPSFLTSFLTGFALTIGVKILAYPFAVVQARMVQRSVEPTKYKTWMHAMKSIGQNEGVGALFRGAGIDIFRGLVSSMLLVIVDAELQRFR